MQDCYKFTNYWKDVGGKKRLDFIIQKANPKNKKSIIDVGCGTGQITIPLGYFDHNVLGVDVHEASINLAKQRNPFTNVTFKVLPVEKVDQKFDLVLSCQVLEHLSNPNKMVKHCTNLLNPKGQFIVTIPNGYGLSESSAKLIKKIKTLFQITKRIKGSNQGMLTANEDNPHIQFFTLPKIKKLLRQQGLTIKSVHNHLFILNAFPFSLLFFYTPKKVARWLEKVDSSLANHIPHWMASGWYITTEKCE